MQVGYILLVTQLLIVGLLVAILFELRSGKLTGPKGDKGDTGHPGPMGLDGRDGQDAPFKDGDYLA